MNKKDRILDLLRQGVISNEEAIELLENLSEVDKKDVAEEDKIEEDIFKNFDPELHFSKTFEDDEEEIKDNENVKDKQKKLDENMEDLNGFMKGIFEKSMGFVSDVRDKVDENFEWTGGQLRLKTQKKSDHKRFIEDTRVVNIESIAGDVKIAKTQEAFVSLDLDYEAFGVDDIDKFISENMLITQESGILNIVNKSKKLSAEMKLNLPEKMYDSISVKLITGNLDLSNIDVDYMKTSQISGSLNTDFLRAKTAEFLNKHGMMKFNQVDVEDMTVENFNGEISISSIKSKSAKISNKNGLIKLLGGKIKELRAENISGDINIDLGYKDVSAKAVNGTIRLSASANAKQVSLTNVNGDIKMSVPANSGLIGHARTTFGKYQTRLELDNPLDIGKSGAALVRQGDHVITFELESKMGNIWIKDTYI